MLVFVWLKYVQLKDVWLKYVWLKHVQLQLEWFLECSEMESETRLSH
jgi:hypothetical protein